MKEIPISVLKFGSSVLPSRRSLGVAVAEIYRELRQARRVIAVVSAFGRTTDRLLARAARYGGGESSARALLVATGELAAASELALALQRAGVSVEVFDPQRAGLLARGEALDAELIALDVARLRESLRVHSVIVLPGFIARDEAGRTCLLGRGGSDLSALFVGAQLGAAVRLLKDVDGIHTQDPAREPAARRFAQLAYADLEAIGGGVVQDKALRFARLHAQGFEVARAGSRGGTHIGAQPSRLHASEPERAPLRVAVCGLGTVGYGVWRELARRTRQFEVVRILVRTTPKRRPRRVPHGLLCTDRETLFASRPDVVVELLGGLEEPARIVAEALERGIAVVTANKALVADRGEELARCARRGGAALYTSASVGGALPALECVRALARRTPILRLRGVLNATSNFVIEGMSRGESREHALARAASLGLCEADVRADLDGSDAAHKLELLADAALAPGEGPDRLPPRGRWSWNSRSGAEQLSPTACLAARERGERLRLVAEAEFAAGGASLRLGVLGVRAGDPLYELPDQHNALSIECGDGSSLLLRGLGAGRAPTTLAVLADLLELARRGCAAPQLESLAG